MPSIGTGNKGDIYVADGTKLVRVAVGTDGKVLTADSTVTEGVDWKTPAASSGGAGALVHMGWN
jgi:hypothetical protein